MNLTTVFETPIALMICSGIFGILITVITQIILNKRSLFGYQVWHNKIGTTADDIVYGSVKVTWNDHPVNHLYLSTLLIKNESMKDYESITVRIFTNDTQLLTHRNELVGTTQLIDYTEDFSNQICIKEGNIPNDDQLELWQSKREYIIPTMNRGQEIQFEFLNAAKTENQPNILVEIIHKGVICKLKKPVILIFGVSQLHAVLIGTLFCIVGLIFIILWVKNSIFAIIFSFLLGYLAVIPGVLFIKLLKTFRELVAG